VWNASVHFACPDKLISATRSLEVRASAALEGSNNFGSTPVAKASH